MQETLNKHKHNWADKDYASSAIGGLFFLLISLVFNYFTNNYAASRQSNFVNDIILDNIPTLNVEIIVIYGALFLILFIAVLIILEPKRLPFVVKSVALFIVIRAVFMTLTHIAPSPDSITLGDGKLLNLLGLNGTGDLFFSGHTGFPFLLALTFWDNKRLRLPFVFISIVLAASVLLGHLHYSIDVFAAYFITYTIFCLARRFFSKDFKYLN
ncbi:MAG: phosphatase PAP2 family protein [Candidatus Vogelbacteria bacterium]|nr:phosphatase PAP2 family protein [Candidatus Vogelbacteria bacterium]